MSSVRYYGNGKLKENEMITYVQHHALLWEYYRQGKEIMPPDIKPILDNLYQGSNFNTLAKGQDKEYSISNTD